MPSVMQTEKTVYSEVHADLRLWWPGLKPWAQRSLRCPCCLLEAAGANCSASAGPAAAHWLSDKLIEAL